MLTMAPLPSVHLLEVEPEVGRFLPAEERNAIARLRLPTLAIAKNEDVSRRIEQAGGFGVLVLEGLLFQQLRVGDQAGMRLLGPGDLVLTRSGSPPMVVSECSCRAGTDARVALLGNEVLHASQRSPRLMVGLHLRLGQLSERLAAQMVICQLPRVDQRLLAMMWLLAESWGRVTPSGTSVPLALTHDALGALIGARRPTVTLAIRDLSNRGAIARKDQGWLLLEAPPKGSALAPPKNAPRLLEQTGSDWSLPPTEPVDGRDLFNSYAALRDTVAELQERHTRTASKFAFEIDRLSASRKRCAASRQRAVRDRLSRSRAPSS